MSQQTKHYGQFDSEKLAEDKLIARKIVSEISNFGISDHQRILIIYGLAMELENIEDLKEFTSFIRERKGSEIFLSGKVGE